MGGEGVERSRRARVGERERGSSSGLASEKGRGGAEGVSGMDIGALGRGSEVENCLWGRFAMHLLNRSAAGRNMRCMSV